MCESATQYKDPNKILEVEVKKIGGVLGDRQAGSVYDKDGISPSLIAGMSHGNNMPYITEVQKYDRQINNDRSDG